MREFVANKTALQELLKELFREKENHIGKNVNCHSFLGMQSDTMYENLKCLLDLVNPNLNDYPKLQERSSWPK